MKEIEIKKTKLLSQREKYPKGANSPTIVTKYKCLCGLGRIIEENVIGFNDHFITIRCIRCLRKYQPFIDQIGDEWIVYEKE